MLACKKDSIINGKARTTVSVNTTVLFDCWFKTEKY